MHFNGLSCKKKAESSLIKLREIHWQYREGVCGHRYKDTLPLKQYIS